MRRIITFVVLAAVAAVLHAAVPAPASADPLVPPAPIVGQLIDVTTDNPVSGTTLRLHADASGSPASGAIASDVTDADGQFSLDPPSADSSYWVEVVRNAKVQGGYVMDNTDGPSWVQLGGVGNAHPVSPGTHLGRVLDEPSFISGIVVNSASGNRLSGIAVSVRGIDARGVSLGNDTTDANGFFRIGVFGEEFGLRVNGGARGYESGWVGCGHGVVPTWGAACSVGPGRFGKIRLDHL